jgi:hypothetical protein
MPVMGAQMLSVRVKFTSGFMLGALEETFTISEIIKKIIKYYFSAPVLHLDPSKIRK